MGIRITESHLTFIKEIDERSRRGCKQGEFKCTCGNIKIFEISRVKSGRQRTCGCGWNIKAPTIKVTCPCGKQFEYNKKRTLTGGKGKYCSQECKYKYFQMPKRGRGTYKLVKENPTQFKPGFTPWSKGKKTGLIPANFKGEDVGYDALHNWVSRHRGKASICEHCGGSKNVQWANKSHEYKRDLSDWISLCRACHVKYDRSNNAWGIATKKYNLQKKIRWKKVKEPL